MDDAGFGEVPVVRMLLQREVLDGVDANVATPQLLDKPLVVRQLSLQRLGGAALLLALTLLLQLLDQLIHFHLQALV